MKQKISEAMNFLKEELEDAKHSYNEEGVSALDTAIRLVDEALESKARKSSIMRQLESLTFATVWPDEKYDRESAEHRAAVVTINKVKAMILELMRGLAWSQRDDPTNMLKQCPKCGRSVRIRFTEQGKAPDEMMIPCEGSGTRDAGRRRH